MAIWHIFSDGTRADIPFNTDEDKTFASNSIAICAVSTNVRIWVATVNDTHLHLLAEGSAENIENFRNLLHPRLQKHYPESKIYLACDLVEERENILSKFMYVYRNCLDFYRKLPGEYPWGSGNIYFSEKEHFFNGRLIDSLSLREQYNLFKTRKQLPGQWRFNQKGRILPESFIEYEAAERFFGSARAFIAFMYVRKEDEAAMKQEVHRKYLEQRNIQDLRRIGNKYCKNMTGRMLPGANIEMRLNVAVRMMREGLSGRTPSLAKALYLQPNDLHLLT